MRKAGARNVNDSASAYRSGFRIVLNLLFYSKAHGR